MKALGNLFSSSKKTNVPSPSSKAMERPSVSAHEHESEMVVVIEENERFRNGRWSYDYLLGTDPMRFKSSAGQSIFFPNPPLAEGWEWVGGWELDKQATNNADADAGAELDPVWVYAMNFNEIDKGYISSSSFSRTRGQFQVRRRYYVREVKPLPVQPLTQANLSASFSNDRSDHSGNRIDDPSYDDEEYEPEHPDTSTVLGPLDAKFEVESDDDEKTIYTNSNAEEEQRQPASLNRPSLTSTQSIKLPEFNIRVRDPTLVAIGKQIKTIEAECKAVEDSDSSDWQNYHKPALTIQIRELEKVCEALRVRIDAEVSQGLDHVNRIEEELKGYTNRLEDAKKKFYFPTSFITLGQGGVYMALDDFWLENASGNFEIIVEPSKTNPQIKMTISGNGGKDDGIAVRLRLDGFKLAGDKGKRIPKIKFDSMKVLVSLRASISINYDISSSAWVVRNPKEDFKIEIKSFKGPYGITQSMVSAVLSVITPALRTRILGSLPPELGHFMRTLPSHFSCRGEFDITGPEIAILSMPLEQSPLLCQIFEYNVNQMDMFQWLQKSMDRSKVIRTMTELLAYVRTYVKHQSSWSTLVTLWNQAAKIYSERVTVIRYEQLNKHLGSEHQQPIDAGSTTITFNTFLTVAEDFRKKRLGAYFKLHYLDGQFSLNQILKFAHNLFHRRATEGLKSATGVRQARLMLLLDKIQANYEQGLEKLNIVSRNIDFVQLKLKASLVAGSKGKFHTAVSDVLAQLPIVLDFRLNKEKNLGHKHIVPYIVNIRPLETGDIFVEVYHYSKEGHETLLNTNEHSKTRNYSDPADSPRRRSSTIGSNGSVPIINEITSIAHNSLNTIRKSVTNVSHAIQEGVQKIDNGTALFPSALTPKSAFLKRRSAFAFSNAERRNHELEETLNDMPQGDVADTIVVMNVSKPHFSLVVDKAITLQPGTEIFTLLVGPRDKDWKPFGAENMLRVREEEDSRQAKQFSTAPVSPEKLKSEKAKDTPESGCPVLIQTSAGIKVMNQIPKAEVTVNLPSLVRFVISHFEDVEQLKTLLEKLTGGEVFEEHLNVFKLILDRFAKYLLLPGVNLEININGKLVAVNNEIVVSLETPDFSADPSRAKTSTQPPQSTTGRRGSSILVARSAQVADKGAPCALKVNAEMNLMDIVEDSLAVEQSLKSFE